MGLLTAGVLSFALGFCNDVGPNPPSLLEIGYHLPA